jgi:hypothetical protein
MMMDLVSFNPKTFRFTPSAIPLFSLDLAQAVKRQIAFARKITTIYPYDPVPDALLLDSQQRYAKFMNLIRLNAVPNPVPSMDVDLFWHTHQLSSSNYLPCCIQHLGRPLNPDDTLPENELSAGLSNTVAAWGAYYFEDYLTPSPLPTAHNASLPVSQQTDSRPLSQAAQPPTLYPPHP